MNRIVWIASYPKSGNTWLRCFLTNYLRAGEVPASLDALVGKPIASSRAQFDLAVGYDSGELTADETDALRPEVYRHLSDHASSALYCKVHDAYTFLSDGRALLCPEATLCAIYLIRNPLDVCVSLAHHSGHANYDKAIGSMADPTYCLSASETSEPNQLRQKLLSWGEHSASWRDASGIRTLVVRYEDLAQHPAERFAAILKFADIPVDAERVQRAIDFSAFDLLQKAEAVCGFAERPSQAERFFRRGRVGDWRSQLSDRQAARLVSDHRDAMIDFDYLDRHGQPIF